MSAKAFGRVRGYLAPFAPQKWLAIFLGTLAGALFIAWVLLLILFTELMLTGGNVHVSGDAARFACELYGTGQRDEFRAERSGLLPTVIAARDSAAGDLLQWLYQKTWTHNNASYLFGLLLIAFVIGLLRSLFIFGQRMTSVGVVTRAVTQLQRDLFHQELQLDVQTFSLGGPSRVAPLLREKVPVISRGLQLWLDVLAREPIKILLLLITVLVLNPLLGVGFILMALLVWMLGTLLARQVWQKRRHLKGKAEGELQRLLGLAGKLRLIKGYAAEDYFRQQYEQHLQKYEQDTSRRLRYEGRITPVWQFLGLVLILVVVTVGAQNVLTNKFPLSCAVGVFACMLSLIVPFSRLFDCWNAVRKAAAASEEVTEFLDRQPVVQQVSGATFLDPLHNNIELQKLGFRDANRNVLLKDLSIRIHAGQRIALISKRPEESLALVYLLNRLVDPTSGSIRIDGQDIRSVTLDSLRSQACVVLQSDLLFPDTVAMNIGCGDPGFTLPHIIEAAKTAHAHHFVQRLPHGYECLIGEAGFPLTVGEQYRVALARAIVRDPAIAIIEEPSDPLDADTLVMLEDTMDRFCPNRTVIFLPHHRTTLRYCDQIFVIEDGQLVACGSHQELVATSELYRHLEYTRFHGVPA